MIAIEIYREVMRKREIAQLFCPPSFNSRQFLTRGAIPRLRRGSRHRHRYRHRRRQHARTYTRLRTRLRTRARARRPYTSRRSVALIIKRGAFCRDVIFIDAERAAASGTAALLPVVVGDASGVGRGSTYCAVECRSVDGVVSSAPPAFPRARRHPSSSTPSVGGIDSAAAGCISPTVQARRYELADPTRPMNPK